MRKLVGWTLAIAVGAVACKKADSPGPGTEAAAAPAPAEAPAVHLDPAVVAPERFRNMPRPRPGTPITLEEAANLLPGLEGATPIAAPEVSESGGRVEASWCLEGASPEAAAGRVEAALTGASWDGVRQRPHRSDPTRVHVRARQGAYLLSGAVRAGDPACEGAGRVRLDLGVRKLDAQRMDPTTRDFVAPRGLRGDRLRGPIPVDREPPTSP
jgi:hypothetical protein